MLSPANIDLSFWEKTFHALRTLTLPHFLETIPNLVPLILHFGGEVALREVLQGIRDVITELHPYIYTIIAETLIHQWIYPLTFLNVPM